MSVRRFLNKILHKILLPEQEQSNRLDTKHSGHIFHSTSVRRWIMGRRRPSGMVLEIDHWTGVPFRGGSLCATWPYMARPRCIVDPCTSASEPLCGVACVCSLEWWCMQLITILSGLLPDPEVQVSAMTICFNTAALCFMLPLGLSTAVRSAAAHCPRAVWHLVHEPLGLPAITVGPVSYLPFLGFTRSRCLFF